MQRNSNTEYKEEADKLFNGLSEGGKVEMPIADSPFGTYIGMFADNLVSNGWWTLTHIGQTNES